VKNFSVCYQQCTRFILVSSDFMWEDDFGAI